MIEIFIKRYENGFDMDIKGHAHFAEKGQDIVCASVSTLIQTLANQLSNVTDSFSIKFSHGQIRTIKASGANVEHVLNTIITGLILLQAEYPNYVSLHVSSSSATV